MSDPITPEQEWWTAAEMAKAALPGLPGTPQGIKQFAEREGWHQHTDLLRRRVGRGGGTLYHWTLLPMVTRKKLLGDQVSKPQLKSGRSEIWAQFDQLPQKDKDEAERRLKALRDIQALREAGATQEVAVHAVCDQIDVSPRTIYNWVELVQGVDDVDHLAYLAPRRRGRRTAQRAAKAPEFLDRLKSLYLRLEGPSFSECFRSACADAELHGWETLIERTALRHIQKTVQRTTIVFAREGLAGLMRCYPPQIRDKSMLRAMEAVNADCHKIDVFVRWEDGRVTRPQIVAFQDIFSGKILSWRVDHDPNKVMVMSAYGEMVEEWGIPEHCLFDNGREFANKWMTAGAPTRFRFKIRDDDPLGVLPMMGVKMHWARPAHGQAKPVERAFRDWASSIAKDPRFHGAYVGNRPDAKPENYGNRAVPIEDFLRVLAERVIEHNARTGRKSETAKGRSFDETFAESYANAPVKKATEEQRRLWLMGQEVRSLHRENGQLKLFDNVYHCDWMSQEAGRRVVARFNPDDFFHGVYLYAVEGEYLGFAECRQKTGFFDQGEAQRDAKRRRQIQKHERKLRDLHTPHSIQEIAADMDERAPSASETLEAKVVHPVFPKITRPLTAPEPKQLSPEQERERAAFLATFEDNNRDRAGEKRAPALVETEAKTEREKTSQDLFEDALKLEARIERGEQISEREIRWLVSFQDTPDYRALKDFKESFESEASK
ncbi:transposase domain-containing protein [Epibacterium ulvae]|uniref:transposase domain-containing protein n=1 Tax=Epibacterium ulvae TaxID=1156985 RepID=UPI002492F61C|nr:transposase domain-containing protein [Epibacterium ulvae]